MNTPIKLRWVLAHIPYDLFLRSANIFAKKMHEKSNGMVEIEIMGADTFVEKYAPGQVPEDIEFMELVNNGTIEMSQMYNTRLLRYNNDMSVLELPFMFRDHEHAVKVLDGEVGLGMLRDLTKRSNIRGLAFTYSGGFRMMVGNEPIESVEDLAGQRVRTARAKVAEDTFRSVGAEPVPVRIDRMTKSLADNEFDIGECTWARYFRTGLDKVTSHVTNTKHSLFLTAIIINDKVWQSLPEQVQTWMQEAALEAAYSERLESLKDGVEAMARCEKEGITVVEWTEEETQRLVEATQPVYEKYESEVTPGLINRVKYMH